VHRDRELLKRQAAVTVLVRKVPDLPERRLRQARLGEEPHGLRASDLPLDGSDGVELLLVALPLVRRDHPRVGRAAHRRRGRLGGRTHPHAHPHPHPHVRLAHAHSRLAHAHAHACRGAVRVSDTMHRCFTSIIT
jgi:hypothetical protein